MLNLIAPINSTSYGKIGTYFVRELDAQGIDFSLTPIGGIQATPDTIELIKKYHKDIRKPSFFSDAPSLKIWHQFDLCDSIGRGTKNGFTVFELDRLTEREQEHCKYLDHVITSSMYHTKVLKQYGCNAHYVPLGVDRSIFNEKHNNKSDETRFLYCGKIEIRKGIDKLVDIFKPLLDDNSNFKLFMMCYNPFLIKMDEVGNIISDGNKEWETYFRGEFGDKLVWLPRLNSDQEVAEIFANTDCLIAPSRSEGFGLPILEMLSMGKWVITGNNTAMGDFSANAFILPDGNFDPNTMVLTGDSLRVIMPSVAKEQAFDEPFFKGQGNWFELSDSTIKEYQKKVFLLHRLKQSGTIPTNRNGIDLSKNLSWKNTLLKTLDIILER